MMPDTQPSALEPERSSQHSSKADSFIQFTRLSHFFSFQFSFSFSFPKGIILFFLFVRPFWGNDIFYFKSASEGNKYCRPEPCVRATIERKNSTAHP